MKSVENQPFGLWKSPFTADARAGRTNFRDVRWDAANGDLVWLERGSENTRLLVKPADGQTRSISDAFDIGGGVGYGGGDFDVRAGTVVFVDRGRQLYRLEVESGTVQPITPEMGMLASPALSPDGRWVVFVASDGQEDALYLVDAHGAQAPSKLAWGADFYMDPVWHPDGTRLAWVEWKHPDMPWDGACIVLANLTGERPRIGHSRLVAGEKDAPAVQPQFSPDGRWLSYLTCLGEWDQLVVQELESRDRRKLVQGQGVTLAPPAWVQGIRSYGWSGNSQNLAYLRNNAGFISLNSVDLSGNSQRTGLGEITWATQLCVSPLEDRLAFFASGSALPVRLAVLDEYGLHVEAGGEMDAVAAKYYSPAQPLRWQSPDGAWIYGLYYPPTNPDYNCEGLPPAVIRIHSGPTMQAVAEFNEEAQYFTSRGFAWLELNYRGSTGYGRTYLRALNGRWGDLDVLDTVSAAEGLVKLGKADANRLALYGSSAGGFTVLNTLIHYPGKFRAAIDAYGVSNLLTLEKTTHKFERFYNARLVGELPQALNTYRERSPEFHADAIRDALAVFQGAEDPVVPPSQSEAIVSALQRNNVPYLYRLYPGEGHRFRRSETRLDFIQTMERFLVEQLSLMN
ncbi:MAG TPA: prolyl oligopeptidase family serine peptidase [Longilinea sp.]|nr:prolyl oligopeptidase family serine peptidase [Longilinea sp.]